MSRTRSSFVTACQQLLALGVVLAALTPAASVISLDIVRESPASTATSSYAGTLAAYVRAAQKPSTVPTEAVDPTVTEIALTPKASARRVAGTTAPREVVSAPEPVTGYGAVGVTWAHGETPSEEALGFVVRTRTDGSWSGWKDLEYHDDHGPDPDSAEGRAARPGTDPLLVGKVDQVQVKASTTSGVLPDDMRLAVIDPGKATATASEKAGIDTATMDGDDGSDSIENVDATTATGGSDALDLQAAVFTPKPVIYSRAQWGADESMREKSSLHYYEVHAGFVHHTVNANDYTRDEVPGIIRSIYAYHTQSRGWSDIGYNFLVDRFGRIWEGRYGGVDRPVVGAHTLNYNDYSFAMSAIGNYETTRPTEATVQAYGALFAWKLSLHGVDAGSTSQRVGATTFEAINGHRDAASTACPGKYLYARIPDIRRIAAQTQRGWAGRELESDLAASPHPDIVVRRASDGRAFVIPTGGLSRFKKAVVSSTGWADYTGVVASPDLTGDGYTDLLATRPDGSVEVRSGDGAGGFAAAGKALTMFADHDLLSAVGDLDGDGANDVVARQVGTGRLDAFLGSGNGTFKRKELGDAWGSAQLLTGAGDLDGDGQVDLVSRDASGAAWLHRGTAGTSFAAPVALAGSWSQWDTVVGGGDLDGDGHADLVVRRTGGDGFVLPGRGDGTFGHVLGPYGRLAPLSGITAGGNVAGNPAPDLVARNGDRLLVVVNAGTYDAGPAIDTGMQLAGADLLLNAGDWDRDGYGDVVVRNARTGDLFLRRGDGQGHFPKAVKIGTGFGSVGLLAAVGDMTGDGYPDLMGQPRGGAMRIYPGLGTAGLGPSYAAHSAISATSQIPVGRWTGDGAPDSLFRQGATTTLFAGNGPGGLTGGEDLGLDLSAYDWVIGISDAGLVGHPDLVVRAKKTGYLFLIPGTPDGFGTRRYLGEGMGVYDLAG
ncbi:MAG: hypothetical protein F2667_07635 [Actinobacteria bacterium]|uniref:Unannotated protein n=1 Tax=freshwater metagenome TaxID=449393 RepID=A0A6J6QG97_9ZZZZ|nr:hypothetical protein [Actinomycetota bacterium]